MEWTSAARSFGPGRRPIPLLKLARADRLAGGSRSVAARKEQPHHRPKQRGGSPRASARARSQRRYRVFWTSGVSAASSVSGNTKYSLVRACDSGNEERIAGNALPARGEEKEEQRGGSVVEQVSLASLQGKLLLLRTLDSRVGGRGRWRSARKQVANMGKPGCPSGSAFSPDGHA